MFPEGHLKGGAIGLFSGGGKSMQVGVAGAAHSFPFGVFPKELEERQGAHPDAWLDDEKWGRFTAELRGRIEKVAEAREEKFKGRFVGTAMNHRAAKHCGIAGRPITAGETRAALASALPLVRGGSGVLFDAMMAGRNPKSKYPMARIGASWSCPPYPHTTILPNRTQSACTRSGS
jgi:hypothetical protein